MTKYTHKNTQNDSDTVQLQGGRNKVITKRNNTIERPSNIWSKYVSEFLTFLHNQGFDRAPKFIEFSDMGTEIVSYVEGDVANEFTKEMQSSETISSTAKLLREYHDISADYIPYLSGDETWMLPSIEPIEVMCHGDFAPYNITMHGNIAMGIIDFDTLHPAPRLWDVAYAIYRFVPLDDNAVNITIDDLPHILNRIDLFLYAYGDSSYTHKQVIECIVVRLRSLVDFMLSEANKGNDQFASNIDDGHHLIYVNDIDFLQSLLKHIP